MGALVEVVELDDEELTWVLGAVGEVVAPAEEGVAIAPPGVVATPVPPAATPGWIEELGPAGTCTSSSEPCPSCCR